MTPEAKKQMSDVETILVDSEADGSRLDHLLASRFPDHSRSYLQRLIKRGNILLNGSSPRKSAVLRTNDKVEIRWPEEKPLTLDAEEIDLPFIHEDDDILVINKPPGMVVHPGAGNRSGTVVNALLGYDAEQFYAMLDEEERPGIVHRLDKDTSGILIVARTPQAKARLTESFSDRKVTKIYLALVAGRLKRTEVRVENNIGRHPTMRKKMAVIDRGKPAISIFTELAHKDGISLIKAEILTGRTHQIRVHLDHLGCPVIGDQIYGNKRPPVKASRQMLHAWQLGIPHPVDHKEHLFIAPVPEDFAALLTQVGIPVPTA
jgi:23S rRNA pseudouridine1911/1915/1917 synthase